MFHRTKLNDSKSEPDRLHLGGEVAASTSSYHNQLVHQNLQGDQQSNSRNLNTSSSLRPSNSGTTNNTTNGNYFGGNLREEESGNDTDIKSPHTRTNFTAIAQPNLRLLLSETTNKQQTVGLGNNKSQPMIANSRMIQGNNVQNLRSSFINENHTTNSAHVITNNLNNKSWQPTSRQTTSGSTGSYSNQLLSKLLHQQQQDINEYRSSMRTNSRQTVVQQDSSNRLVDELHQPANVMMTTTSSMEKDERDREGFLEPELENLGLGSFEKDLPVELSFLIRQQAFCMARMNYLDRQIRELKDSRHISSTSSHSHSFQTYPHNNPSTTAATTTNSNNYHQNLHHNRLLNVNAHHGNNNIISGNTTNLRHNKNFIPSDDSGGEYSRATISDDDELSSLLDQIAKSVRPDRNVSQSLHIGGVGSDQLQPQRPSYNSAAINSISGVIGSQIHPPPPLPPPHHHQYAIIHPNSSLHHHQAVPVFVMGSPIAVATAHPSSINSNVLPGVHFQPEPRYNQYYEDFYTQQQQQQLHQNSNNNNITSIQPNLQRQLSRLQQFDSSISAVEQLVSRKEKRQIKSQLKSADNWLKMRTNGVGISSNLNNSNNTNIETNNNITSNNYNAGVNTSSSEMDTNGSTSCATSSVNKQLVATAVASTSANTIVADNSNTVIDNENT